MIVYLIFFSVYTGRLRHRVACLGPLATQPICPCCACNTAHRITWYVNYYLKFLQTYSPAVSPTLLTVIEVESLTILLVSALGLCHALVTVPTGQVAFASRAVRHWAFFTIGLTFLTNLWAILLIAWRFVYVSLRFYSTVPSLMFTRKLTSIQAASQTEYNASRGKTPAVVPKHTHLHNRVRRTLLHHIGTSYPPPSFMLAASELRQFKLI